MKHTVFFTGLALVAQAFAFTACELPQRDLAISGPAHIGSSEAKGGRALSMRAGETVDVTIRLEGSGVWEKPGAMSCPISAGYFSHLIRGRASLDAAGTSYSLPLTVGGKLQGEDSMCGTMTAKRIDSIERVELVARMSPSESRCRDFCAAKPADGCFAACASARAIVARPVVSSSAMRELLREALTSSADTVGTGLELVFDSLEQ